MIFDVLLICSSKTFVLTFVLVINILGRCDELLSGDQRIEDDRVK